MDATNLNEQRVLKRREAAKLNEQRINECARRGDRSIQRQVGAPTNPSSAPSLEALEQDAAKVFDETPKLQAEFAACSDPKGAWLAYIRSVYLGRTI